ncbi:hypothetical protein B0H15DRAFT_950597 [Mycena belliarum]|uniref:Uncharacterized protein n=1 Tax=Mycena belliarum TaxID=1033014 RepID=A0AAD6U523_9AGAR|nr:hypothetical protein B0H15DRAFT_950597 [Mycena belliae]
MGLKYDRISAGSQKMVAFQSLHTGHFIPASAASTGPILSTPPSTTQMPCSSPPAPTAPAPTAPAGELVMTPRGLRPKHVACEMPIFLDPGVNKEEHDLSTKSWYVAGPARVPGTYASPDSARKNTDGVHNGRIQGCKTLLLAAEWWDVVCRELHGEVPVCPKRPRPRVTPQTRIALTPMRSRTGEFWACCGVAQVFETRLAAMTAAEELDLKDIHIVGGYDVAALEAFAVGTN